jgi:hypothetical protein
MFGRGLQEPTPLEFSQLLLLVDAPDLGLVDDGIVVIRIRPDAGGRPRLCGLERVTCGEPTSSLVHPTRGRPTAYRWRGRPLLQEHTLEPPEIAVIERPAAHLRRR